MVASTTFWIIAGLRPCAYQPSERTAFLPLFASFGAAGSNMRAERLHSSAAYSVLRMDLFAFRRISLWRSDRASIPV
jgi:hypothetical protein